MEILAAARTVQFGGDECSRARGVALMGVIKVNRPKQDWWERVYFLEVFRGLGITIKHAVLSLIKPGYIPTYQYPEEMRPIPDRFRGRHRLVPYLLFRQGGVSRAESSAL